MTYLLEFDYFRQIELQSIKAMKQPAQRLDCFRLRAALHNFGTDSENNTNTYDYRSNYHQPL